MPSPEHASAHEHHAGHTHDECFHCGEDIPTGFDASLNINGEEARFCCYGCSAVAEMIVTGGLENFYKHRTELSARPQTLESNFLDELKLYDDPELQTEFVDTIEPETQTQGALLEASLTITQISCAACIWLIEQECSKMPGVESFSVNHTTHKASLQWRQYDQAEKNDTTHLSDILIKIHQLGYQAFPYDQQKLKQALDKERRSSIFRIAVAGIATMQNMMFAVPLYLGLYSGIDEEFVSFFRWVSLLMATPVVLFSAFPFYRSAWKALKVKQLNMDVPVSIAIICAFLASAFITMFKDATLESDVYFDSVAMFTFFLLLGRFLEMQTRHKHLNCDAELTALLPTTATLLEKMPEADSLEAQTEEQDDATPTTVFFDDVEYTQRSIPAYQLQPCQLIQVRQGQMIPADATVHSGHSRIDESALTGEFLPIEKIAGDKLFAGTANVENTLIAEVLSTVKQSRVAAIIKLLDKAQTDKPESIALVDKISRYFVAVVLLASAVSGFVWADIDPSRAFEIMLAVLVVTCPCALALATPTALTAANTRLRQLGFLPAKGHVMETLSETTDVIFDKTGTLTEGKLQIKQVDCYGQYNREQTLAIIAALEAHSTHPIAKVFEPYYALAASDVATEVGQGLTGHLSGKDYRLGRFEFVMKPSLASNDEPQQHSTPHAGHSIYLSDGATLLARVLLTDQTREGAKQCINHLKRSGIQLHVLSGDQEFSVRHTALELGINQFKANQTPEQKLAYAKDLHEQGRVVTMVGDGINDLPILSGAQLSIAMGQASDLTKLNSDAVLLNENLETLQQAFQVSQKTRTIIKQNMGWALSYNLLMLPLAAIGLIPPYLAALGMSLSSLIVVINSLRLRK